MPEKYARLSWVPAPASPVDGALRLFCDQELHLKKGVTRTTLRQRSGESTLEQAAEFLASESVAIAKALAATERPLFVALTGGQDSRTIFAALVAAEVPFKAFTLRLSDGASLKDVNAATQICKAFGVRHTTVATKWRGSANRRRQYLAHSGGIDGDRGRQYAAGDYYRDIPDGALVLHGGSLGLSKLAFEIPEELTDSLSAETVLKFFAKDFGPFSEAGGEAFKQWFLYRAENAIGSVGDHFFLDQRRACWGADNRHAEDIFGFEWFLFANSWPLIDSFWSVPKAAREGLLSQKKAIELMVPGFNQKAPAVNPPLTRLDAWRGRLSRRGLQKLSQRARRWFGGS